MTIGASLFLITVGAIIRFALNVEVAGVDLDTVGLILIIAGVAGLLLGLAMYFMDQNNKRPAPRQGPPPPR